MLYLFGEWSCYFLLMRREKKEIVPTLGQSFLCSSLVQIGLIWIDSIQ